MQIRIFHGLTCEDCDTQNSLVIDTGSDWIDWVCLDCKNESHELIHPDDRDDIDLTKLVYSIGQEVTNCIGCGNPYDGEGECSDCRCSDTCGCTAEERQGG